VKAGQDQAQAASVPLDEPDPEESVADAMNAAAADTDATEEEIDEMAAAMGTTGDEFREELLRMAESAPDSMAGLVLALQGGLAKLAVRVASKGAKRLEIPELESGKAPRTVLAVGCKMAFRRMGWDFSRVPWWGVLLAGMSLCLHAQISGARTVVFVKQPEGAAVPAPGGATA
jgi:hypothetical protein